MTRPGNAHRVRLLNPPPWPVRVQWAARQLTDRVGCWLARHANGRAAERWWRALHMW